MTALVEFLFPAPERRSVAGTFIWWESRRLQYNLIVGGTGVVTLGAVSLLLALPPGGLVAPPLWPAVILYGILANVCYSFGALLELLLAAIWGRKLLPTGPAIFRAGLTFSVGLTLLPTIIFSLDWLRRLVMWALL